MKKSLATLLSLFVLLASSFGASLAFGVEEGGGVGKRLVRAERPLPLSPKARSAIQLIVEARRRRMSRASAAGDLERELAKTPAIVGRALADLQKGDLGALEPVEAQATRLERLFETLEEQDGARPQRAAVLAAERPKVLALVSALRAAARAASPPLREVGLRVALDRMRSDLHAGPAFPNRVAAPTVRSLGMGR